MELSLQERLLLRGQFQILAELKPDERDYYQRMEEIVVDGYELHYDDLVTWLADGDTVVTSEECRFVLDTLSMFEALHFYTNEHGVPEGVNEQNIRFIGFDGNNETKLMAYAEFFCNRNDTPRFECITGPDFSFNSHCPTIDAYERMRKVWLASGKEVSLTESQVIELANACDHSSSA